MQNIMFSFVCVCVFVHHTHTHTHAANYFLCCVLCAAHYINIDMRAPHCACLYAAKWDLCLPLEVVVEEWIGRTLPSPAHSRDVWSLGTSVGVRVCVWMSCCVGILHLCSSPHQYSLLTSTARSLPASSAALHSCQAFQQKLSSLGCSISNNIPECHIIFGMLTDGILRDLMYVCRNARHTCVFTWAGLVRFVWSGVQE